MEEIQGFSEGFRLSPRDLFCPLPLQNFGQQRFVGGGKLRRRRDRARIHSSHPAFLGALEVSRLRAANPSL